MELYATGFNAWGQLEFRPPLQQEHEEPDDIFEFRSVLEAELIGNVKSFLSCTRVIVSGQAKVAGSVCTAQELPASLSQKHLHGFIDAIAFETGFVALQNGQVWTWGDGRYASCLGRDVTADQPAETPGLVHQLQDLPTGKIVKVAAGGYTLAALTEGNDLYCWGSKPPGDQPAVLDLSADPVPIDVYDKDIVDIGLGESHAIVLTSEGEVYVIGDNRNGQLGLGKTVPSATSWTKIDLSQQQQRQSDRTVVVVGVTAGPKSSFILVRSEN